MVDEEARDATCRQRMTINNYESHKHVVDSPEPGMRWWMMRDNCKHQWKMRLDKQLTYALEDGIHEIHIFG